MQPSAPLDDLKASLDRTLNGVKSRAYEAKKSYDQSSVGKIHKEWSAWARFWTGFVRACAWIWYNLIFPVTKRLFRLARWLARKYRDLWLTLTYGKDQYGAREFRKGRAAAMVLCTTSVIGISIVFAEIPAVGLFWYLPLVQYNEELYLYNSQKVSEGATSSTLDDVHEVHGCETMPCNDQNSVTFMVRGTWFNEAWSIVHNGTLFYPGYVAGAVAPVMEKCVITSYGIRKKFRTIARQWDIFPDLVQVKSCNPVDVEQKGGVILHNRDYRR
jgi:hypothetical protein